MVPLERILYGHPLAGLSWETVSGGSIGTWIGPNWECMFVHRKQGLFLSVYVDDIKMAGKKKIMAPIWKKLMESVDLYEPASFLDHVNLGCTQRECKPNEIIVEQYKEMFESRVSAGATEKLPGWENLTQREGHVQKCLERYCELAKKKAEQPHKLSSPCLDDQFKEEELKSIGEISKVCSQLVLKKACTQQELVDQTDILWSVNKHARSVIRWTPDCDRRLARLISYIHLTSDYRQYCHVGNAAQHCRLGFVPRLRFCWRLKINLRESVEMSML